jgi:regulator of nucleoside diphosphate kinase
MRNKTESLILTKDDHDLIMNYIKFGLNHSQFTSKDTEALEAELKKAILVNKESLPQDVVCLNSTVTIQDENNSKVMELTLVTPERADIRQRKISIFSPVAVALIGFRKGMEVAWRVPAGMKKLRILEVRNR